MTLHRYLLREISGPFFVGLALFFVVTTFAELLQISDAVTGLGVTAGDFLRALLYSLPPLLGLLLPVSGLFATLLAVGRLASDREILRWCAAGGSPYRLLLVPGALGVVLGLLSAAALIVGEPWGLAGLHDVTARGAQRALAEGVRVGVANEWVQGVSFLARRREGEGFGGVTFADRRQVQHPILISARRGEVRPGTRARDIVFALQDGAILDYRAGREGHRVIRFDRARYRLDVGELVQDKLFNVTRAQGMTPAQLIEAARDEPRLRRRAQYVVTLHRKMALPVATLLFTLLAVPLAIRPGRGSRARGFLFSALIVGAYYYIGRAAELSARSGGIPAELAAWLPNLLGVCVLAVALARLGRRAA